MGRAIFISYRRNDSEGEAGRLFDDLVRAFGDDSVFMDVAGIDPGTDFRKAIDDNVSTCGVLLAVIGPQWVSATDTSGNRRIDDENDFVRLETASALARNIPVIPVLVHDAKMPRPEQLPKNLESLAFRNSVEITHARWNSDVQLLTNALRQYIGPPASASTSPVHATVPVQLPAPNGSGTQAAVVPVKSHTALLAGIVIGVLMVIGAFALFALHRSGADRHDRVPPTVNPQALRDPTAGRLPHESTEAAASFLPGTWLGQRTGGRNTLIKLTISGSGDHMLMHAWGDCPGCDWGEQAARLHDGEATATWNFTEPMGGQGPGRVAEVTARPEGNDLIVRVLNTFAGNKEVQAGGRFVRAR